MVPSVMSHHGRRLVWSSLNPTMGGEDFSYFANEVPGFFYRLGTLREGTVYGPAPFANVPCG